MYQYEIAHVHDFVLYRGDCLDILPMLNKSYAIVTDPPYGIGFKKGNTGNVYFGGNQNKSKIVRSSYTIMEGDNISFNPSLLLEFSHVITWGANHYAKELPTGRWLVWDKLAGKPAWDSFSDVELAWQNGKGKDVIFSHLWKGVCKASENGISRQHPTQKPIKLMEWCISRLPSNIDTIIDPYMGSGTTGIACINTGKKFIGIEIDEDYFEIAYKRIAEHTYKP